jgi:hypothetical protein
LGNHGQAAGVALAKGVAGEALVFDGQAGCVDLGNPKARQITGDLTIVFWVMPARLRGRQNPFNKCYGGEGTMILEPAGTVFYFYGRAGADTDP